MLSAPTSSGSEDSLFFGDLVASYVENPRFLPRDWLAGRVGDMLDDPQCRFLLLTAAPGAGKSSFVAQLAAAHPGWLRYFIRRDQHTLLSDPGAGSLLMQVGFQMAALHPEVFTLTQVELSIRQRLGDVGDATGAQIERVVASPFHRTVVDICQQVAAAGSVTGVRIGEWVAEPRRQTPAELQFPALLDPAGRLGSERIVILVDGLDEVRYHSGGASLLDWLEECPELPANVRFVLTSRPDDELLAHFREKQQPWLREERLDPGDADVQRDIKQYARGLAAEPAVRGIVEAGRFVADAVTKANGNVGYLDAVGRAIDQAVAGKSPEQVARAVDLSALPGTLEGLYASFLHQIRDRMRNRMVEVEGRDGSRGFIGAWQAAFVPVLGVLAVANEPLLPRQLRRFGEIPGDPEQALVELGQFLDRRDGRVRLYHATLAQFLTDASAGDLYQDAARWHRRIVLAIRAGAVDDYDFSYLSEHLAALDSDAEARGWLSELITRPYMQAKFARYGSHGSFAVDVDRAAAAARRHDDVASEVRCAMAHASLSDIASDMPKEALSALARIGLSDRAEAFAAMIADDSDRAAAYRFIAVAEQARGDTDRAEKSFQLSVTAARRIRYARGRYQALLATAEALPAMAVGPVSEELLTRMPDLANEDDRGGFLARLARLLAINGDARALEPAGSLYNEERDRCSIDVAEALVERGDLSAALVAAAGIGAAGERERVIDGIRDQHRDMVDLVDPAADPLTQARSLSAAGWRLAGAGEFAAARPLVERALAIVATLPVDLARSEVEATLAEALAWLGDQARATRIARGITHGVRGSAVRAVAVAQVGAGEPDLALTIVAEMPERDAAHDDLVIAVALALAEHGHGAAALDLVDSLAKIPVIGGSADDIWNSHRAALFRALAHRFSDAGDAKSALDAADRAARASAAAADPFGVAAAHVETAYALARAGDVARAPAAIHGDDWSFGIAGGLWLGDGPVASLMDLVELVADSGRLPAAVELAGLLRTDRQEALIEVARRMAVAGQAGLAATLAERALQLAGGDDLRLPTVLRTAADVFAAAGDGRHLDEIAERADASYVGGRLRLELIHSAVARGDFDRTLALLRACEPDSYDKPAAFGECAGDLVAAEHWREAAELADRVEGALVADQASVMRAQSLSHLALALANAGRDGDSRELLEKVLAKPPEQAPLFLPQALSGIAAALLTAGRSEEAAGLAERSLAAIRTRGWNVYRAHQTSEAAVVLAGAGRLARARSVIENLVPDDWFKAYIAVVQGLRASGHANAARTFAQHARELGDDVEFAEREVACAQAAVGDHRTALATVEGMSNPHRQQEALDAMAPGLITAGFCAELIAATQAIDADFTRRWTLRTVGLALARAGEVGHALTAAAGLTGDERVHVLAAAARAQQRAGRGTEARMLADEALAVSESEPKDYLSGFRYTELGELSRALVDTGRPDLARAILEDLLRDGYDNDQIRCGVVGALAHAGEINRAVAIVTEVSGAYVARDDALCELAPVLVRAGRVDTLVHAVEVGGAIPRTVERVVPVLITEGHLAEAMLVWRSCLDRARTEDTEQVFNALAAGAPAIAALDHGDTLLAACEAAFAVTTWWE